MVVMMMVLAHRAPTHRSCACPVPTLKDFIFKSTQRTRMAFGPVPERGKVRRGRRRAGGCLRRPQVGAQGGRQPNPRSGSPGGVENPTGHSKAPRATVHKRSTFALASLVNPRISIR